MFKDFEFNEKPEELIYEVNGMVLPTDYLAFMKEHNGGEGPLGETVTDGSTGWKNFRKSMTNMKSKNGGRDI